ncbi:MAG TPA: biopolymer transporter ExbD [Ignavibacteriaceae bacterium]|jgi:biopolymer transport protein ExbD|nr:biopolymer transporter ExbD [Ignavibacteriaceae bacterium]
MAVIQKKKIKSAEIPTSSMADIAFLLLLFFLVATVIDVDTGIGLSLPEFVEDVETVEVSKDRMAAVLINENGDVLLDGNIIAIPQISKSLKPRIESKIELPANKKLIVSVKTDRKTNYNRYIQALDQIKLAYFEVRDEYSLTRFGRKYINLNSEEQEELKEKIPITISIAEPEKVK